MRSSVLLSTRKIITPSQAIGVVVFIFGLTVFISWLLEIDDPRWVFAVLYQTHANTAAALSLLALALITNRRVRPRLGRFAFLISLAAFIFGTSALFEYLSGRDFWINQLFSGARMDGAYARRMSPVTAVAITLLAAAQWLALSQRRVSVIAAQSLCMVSTAIATATLLAYVYRASSLLYLADFVPMAFATAAAVQLLSLGTLLIHADSGLIAPLTSKTMTSKMGRRLLLSAWLALPVLSWLSLEGQSRNMFGPQFGVAVLVTVGLAMLSALILWHTATAELGERRVQYLNRIYSVLSEVNSLIVRVTDRTQLFQEASRIAVQRGGFPRAWFGIVNSDNNAVELVAWQDAAHSNPTPTNLGDRLSLKQSDGELSPIARAIHGCMPVISNDVVADKAHPFRSELLADGIRSLAIFPLILNGKPIGIFKLHAEMPNFFHDEEMRLLSEMAGDIVFAMNNLEQRRTLDHLAYFDSLTNLANARLFEERVSQTIDNATRQCSPLALIVFDIISFRLVNEVHGRQVGDQVLQQLAQRLLQCSSESRSSRLGSNLFALVVPGIATEPLLVKEYERLMGCCFGEAFSVSERVISLTARSGIAILHADGKVAKTLLDHAESALRAASASGELYRFYDPASNERNAVRLDLQARLTRALAQSEFVLYYQIKVDARSMEPCGAEALLRWHDVAMEPVSPCTFVPILEEIGLIGKVGAWALRQASSDSSRVIQPFCQGFRISVNVSASQLLEPDFVEKVQLAFGDYAYKAEIDLELTESLVMRDIEGSIVKLRRLRELGIKIAIDDFGTGYSSMAYLARLPLDYLKIDRAFVTGLPHDRESVTVISSIIGLGHALGLQVIAEGVEDEAQATLLASLGCDQLQGYYFSKPEPLAAMLVRLNVAAPVVM